MPTPINIYQLFPRLFGNKCTTFKPNGSKAENGCGTFADIDETALNAIRDMGITHIWLTGILKHASESAGTHPDITKGRAGSPYAVTNYHDVDPDLGTMADLEQLIGRIHNAGLKVLMDFIPNHVARQCIGFEDDNFYLLEGRAFVNPIEGTYTEFPAKATGNNVFVPNPGINDWYDTIKLNYDSQSTWNKMLSILKFWCGRNIDGFRVDMAEMVPVRFWQWAISELRKEFQPLLIAEIYHPELYRPFLEAGFDYLYDKVGLYNTLDDILCHGHEAHEITKVWQGLDGMDGRMLRFFENHDEKRIASPQWIGDAFAALPAVTVSALLNTGPFMTYNGQESGETGVGATGYSGDDGRTTIFDYAHMPQHQKWMNGGLFDGGPFEETRRKLFDFYSDLLNFRLNHPAIFEGAFYDLMWCNPWYNHFDPQFVYAFLRYSTEEHLLIIANFNRTESRDIHVKIPQDALELMGLRHAAPLDMNTFASETLHVLLQPSETKIINLDLIQKQ